MKPKIFVGSSTEGLDLANAFQENLDYDAEVTVWTQNIFKLNEVPIESLVKVLNNSDYAVFILTPDDISIIRNEEFNIPRDNLIFEIGLFTGKLGKEKVFYAIPIETKDFHLPSDLFGLLPGKYSIARDDKNYRAALGPFSNQIRTQIKNYTFNELDGFKDETQKIKDIVVNKPKFWEFNLSNELLKNNIKILRKKYEDLESGSIFQVIKSVNEKEFIIWIFELIINSIKIVLTLKQLLQIEFLNAIGKPGEPGDPIKIKNTINNIFSNLNAFISLELELSSIEPPVNLSSIKPLISGDSKKFINMLEEWQNSLEQIETKAINNEIKISLTVPVLFDFEKVFDIILKNVVLSNYHELSGLLDNVQLWINKIESIHKE